MGLIKRISNSRFPVFIAENQHQHKKYVAKFFPNEGQLNSFYVHELRAASLHHPHINSPSQSIIHKEVSLKGKRRDYSIILSDYCPNGEFLQLFEHLKDPLEEKLVRSYFHQLVEAVEYMHNSGFAHLDLKLENLILDSEY